MFIINKKPHVEKLQSYMTKHQHVAIPMNLATDFYRRYFRDISVQAVMAEHGSTTIQLTAERNLSLPRN